MLMESSSPAGLSRIARNRRAHISWLPRLAASLPMRVRPNAEGIGCALLTRPLNTVRSEPAGKRVFTGATRREVVKFCAGLMALSLLTMAHPAHGIDMQAWGRNLRHHQDWTSVEFRNPVTGIFIASRAGSEDPKRGATLTLTAAPMDGCAASVVLVIATASPNPRDAEEQVTMGFGLDDFKPAETDARIVLPRGDRFEFIEILGDFDPSTLENHRTASFSLGKILVARFSLKGFAEAWSEVQRVCQGFVSPLK